MPFARPTPEQLRRKSQARKKANLRGLMAVRGREAVMGGSVQPVEQPERVKIERKKRQPIRDSARGEACQMALPGVCLRDPAATIWSHARWPWAGKGGATKAFDLCGCYACTACDAVYDGNARMPPNLTREEVDEAWMVAHLRSLVLLAAKGLV